MLVTLFLFLFLFFLLFLVFLLLLQSVKLHSRQILTNFTYYTFFLFSGPGNPWPPPWINPVPIPAAVAPPPS